MAYNEKLSQRLRDALADVPGLKVEEKRMFRGSLFMVNGKMCVTAGDDKLMFRIPPDMHAEAVTKKGVSPMLMKGREYKGYIHVHEDSIKSKKDFNYWLNVALEYNKTIKPGNKKKKK